MEEVIVLVFQIFFEVLLQFFGSVPINVSFGSERVERGCGWFLLHACLGGFLGLLSAMIAPELLLPSAALRIANLFVAPLVAGGLAYMFAKWVKSRGRSPDPAAHFWNGLLFAFMFGAARLAFANH